MKSVNLQEMTFGHATVGRYDATLPWHGTTAFYSTTPSNSRHQCYLEYNQNCPDTDISGVCGRGQGRLIGCELFRPNTRG